MKTLQTVHGSLDLPTFFPDGTIGVVRSVDSRDLESAQIPGIVVSTFHLLVHDIKTSLHDFMNFHRPILTDSGGFQVFSLLRDNPRSGKISDKGFEFSWDGKKIDLTPEESIKQQLRLGSDILICLDQCTDPAKDYQFQKEAVELTIKWAKRCKEEFTKNFKFKILNSKKTRPILFAVIQGGDNKDLRKYCAEELIKIGFDGYCYGGWPVSTSPEAGGGPGKPVLLEEILEYTASLMPSDKPKYALGVGKPEDIIKCVKWGYDIFDCVIPTREARHKKMYIFNSSKGLGYTTFSLNTKSAKDFGPISKNCDCHTCKNFSRAYLYHLFKVGDTLAFRLATIHNLRFYTNLMQRLA